MAGTPQVDQTFLKGLYQAAKDRALSMAPHFQPGVGATELDGDDLEAIWDRRAMSIEEEWELWRQGRTPETANMPILSPEQIGLMVFPERQKLAQSGGRIEPAQQIGWINSTAKRMAERRAVRQAMIDAPPPLMMEGV